MKILTKPWVSVNVEKAQKILDKGEVTGAMAGLK